jgi:hypothetical protein
MFDVVLARLKKKENLFSRAHAENQRPMKELLRSSILICDEGIIHRIKITKHRH